MKVKKFVLTPDERMLAFKGPMKMSNSEYSRKLNKIVMQLQDRMATEAALKLGFRGRIPLAKGRFLAMVEDIGGLLPNQSENNNNSYFRGVLSEDKEIPEDSEEDKTEVLSEDSEDDEEDLNASASGFTPAHSTKSGGSSTGDEELRLPLNASSPRCAPTRGLMPRREVLSRRLYEPQFEEFGVVRDPGPGDCFLHNVNERAHWCPWCFVCWNCDILICYNHHQIYSTIDVSDDDESD